MPAPRQRSPFRQVFDRVARHLAGKTFRITLVVLVAITVAVIWWLLLPFWRLAGRFDDRTVRQPSRLYARASEVAVGQASSPAALAATLDELGYRRLLPGDVARPGSQGLPVGAYRVVDIATGLAGADPSGEGSAGANDSTGEVSQPTRAAELASGALAVRLRRYPTVEGPGGGGQLEVRYRDGVVTGLMFTPDVAARHDEASSTPARPVPEARQRLALEPALLASYYGPTYEERRPIVVGDLPEHVVRAVLAAEDARFFRHGGLSISGIARAIWSNTFTDNRQQGGSTLTQQLVKNLFLTPERSFGRKAREAVLALLLELRFSKQEILQAYLNEIFWGRSGSVNLVGIGAVAHAYFGKDAAALDPDEAALLAGIIQAPNALSPIAHPERAKKRRDWVLDRMAELDWLSGVEVAAAQALPIGTEPRPVVVRRAGWFADWALAEARTRFAVNELADSGYVLLSTLEWPPQRRAEELLREGLDELERGLERGRSQERSLQAALVSLDPRSGEVLAWVGGRDFRASQFDRVVQAHRQIGSAIKPVVLAAALIQGVQPATLVEDAPLRVSMAGRIWEPANDDDQFLGWMSLRQAVEESRNVPVARLALQTGLPVVAQLAHAMGLAEQPAPLPSLSLGAVEATPLELATVYATLAGQGTRPSPPHGLLAVWNRYDERLPAPDLPAPVEVLQPDVAFMVTSVLQGVLDRGTGVGARRVGLRDPLAGKSGTTNDRRDSWFAGYAPDRVTVVWIGYDDNTPTRLSGSRAAVPMWAKFMQATRPADGYPRFEKPPGVVAALVDPETGDLATPLCPTTRVEMFTAGRAPQQVCLLHANAGDRALGPPTVDPDADPGESGEPGSSDDPGEVDTRRKGRFKSWLERVFGGGQREAAPAPPPPPPPDP